MKSGPHACSGVKATLTVTGAGAAEELRSPVTASPTASARASTVRAALTGAESRYLVIGLTSSPLKLVASDRLPGEAQRRGRTGETLPQSRRRHRGIETRLGHGARLRAHRVHQVGPAEHAGERVHQRRWIFGRDE